MRNFILEKEPLQLMSVELSILIPVYNSENIVAKTIDAIIDEMEKRNYDYEIILVNDGSKDGSWKVIKTAAQNNDRVQSINLLHNYGQHTAVLCAMKHARGRYMITMDDDMQNPPSEIHKLYNKIKDGHDVVFGEFKSKKHAFYRKLGTKIIDYLNQQIFNKPRDLHLTNFRIFRKEVADRVLDYHTNYPYIPGLLLMHADDFANVETNHQKREVGRSGYSLMKISKLVSRLLINYSSYPLNVLTRIGIFIAFVSFAVSLYAVIKTFLSSTEVPGWASLMFMLSFLNGITIIMMGVLGIYVSRTLNQVSSNKPYYIKEVIK